MNKSSVYNVTALGKALLGKPQGRITGDTRLLMGLIDGKASVAEIAQKIPPSVRVHLGDMFKRLLNYGVIEEKGGDGSAAAPETRPQASLMEDTHQKPAGVLSQPVPEATGNRGENKQRSELERELMEVRAKLEATVARQQKVEQDYLLLAQQISAYAQDKRAESVADTGNPPAGPATTLRGSLSNIGKLNHALLEQQEILGNTLKLHAYHAQLDARPHPDEYQPDVAREAQEHPHYKALRGLEFFKGFSNMELLDFLKLAKWQEAGDGDTILNEGEVGMSFYVIVSGSVNIFRKGNMLTTLSRGDFFGEFAYLSGEEPVRSARAVAAGACELLAVDPLDIEFSPVQLRLRVVEALLRGQVRRALISDQRIDKLSDHPDNLPHESR